MNYITLSIVFLWPLRDWRTLLVFYHNFIIHHELTRGRCKQNTCIATRRIRNLDVSSQSAERSEFIISSRANARAVCELRVGPSELQTRSSHLYKVALIHKVHEVALIKVVRKRVSFQDRQNENTPKFPGIKI